MAGEMFQPSSQPVKELFVEEREKRVLIQEAQNWPSWFLTPRQLDDLEMLLVGGFSPLEGFMVQNEYEAVLSTMRLPTGALWPIPIQLDVSEALAEQLEVGGKLALRDGEGHLLGVLHLSSIWKPDRFQEAQEVFGTKDEAHPGVHQLFHRTYPWNVGGKVEGVQLPSHQDFQDLRLSPSQLRQRFGTLEQDLPIIAFQTRNPMHKAHYHLTELASQEIGGHLLLHPVVGENGLPDVDYVTRVKCYQALLPHYPQGSVSLALLPLSMRMAGPREAVWHGLIRKNYGCSHMIVGRDHAGVAHPRTGEPFYGPYAAQELLESYALEMGMKAVALPHLVFVEEVGGYVPHHAVKKGMSVCTLSGSELRSRLKRGKEIPDWFTFPEVREELKKVFPPTAEQGVTVLFTGLSGAGKSTVAKHLAGRIQERCNRKVTLLDGDGVRRHLSMHLGFSKADRDANVMRIGFVASEVTKHGGIAICAPIAPYEETRQAFKALVERWGRCLIVHVSTPLEVCEKRDPKGIYRKAREGVIKNFTGISDPYENPVEPDLYLDTTELSIEGAVDQVFEMMKTEGYLDCVELTS